jgi:hypothetical protein
MLNKIKSVFIFLFVLFTAGLHAEVDSLKQSADASLAWVAVIDQGKFKEAWDNGSVTLKLKVPENSWETILNATRKPLGKVLERKVVDQRTSQNPPGLPAGDYIVMIYKTDFESKKGVTELVTLVQESDGKWRGLTYQVQ